MPAHHNQPQSKQRKLDLLEQHQLQIHNTCHEKRQIPNRPFAHLLCPHAVSINATPTTWLIRQITACALDGPDSAPHP
jgi:hypothetical protein